MISNIQTDVILVGEISYIRQMIDEPLSSHSVLYRGGSSDEIVRESIIFFPAASDQCIEYQPIMRQEPPSKTEQGDIKRSNLVSREILASQIRQKRQGCKAMGPYNRIRGEGEKEGG